MNKLLSLTLATLLVLSCYIAFHTNAPAAKSQKIRFLSAAAPSSQIVLTYNFDMLINTVESTGDLSHTQENIINCKSRAKFSPIYNAISKLFTVVVDYEDIQIIKSDPLLDQTSMQYEYTDKTEETKEILYIATIHADSGKILSLTKTAGDDDKMIDQMTKMQLAQIFPDIRRTQSGLLSQGVEETEIGTVVPHETTYIDEEDSQIIEKYYTEQDVLDSNLDWVQNAQVSVEFEEILKADPENLIVKSAKQSFDFYYEIDELLSESETQDSGIDAIGDMEVHIDTELEIESVVYNEEYGMELDQLLDEISEGFGDYEDVSTQINKATVFINDLSDDLPEYVVKEEDVVDMDDSLLRQSAPLYTKNYDVVSQKILGKTIKLQVQYRNYGELSNVQAVILLDERVLKTMVDVTYKHCGGSKLINYNKVYNMQLFQVSYPILGIITIQVQADFSADYGFDFYYGGMSQAHGCEISVKPYFKPGVTALGGVNALVAKGGVYAKGSIANTYLNFYSHIKGFPPALTGSINLSLDIKPFEFELGAWYQLFGCDFKKIFKWRPSFKKVCGYGNRKDIKIFSTGVGRVNSYQIFNYNWRI